MILNQDLCSLTNTLVKEVKAYGILEVSLEQYQVTCNKIIAFAAMHGKTLYSPELMDEYLAYIDAQLASETICFGYHRFQNRVVRMLRSLADNGQVDFSSAIHHVRKYPVSEDISALIEEILEENHVSAATKADLLAPMRHLFAYASEQGYNETTIDDTIIMRYLIDEVPVTNSGSTGRTLRCVKYITEYLKAHGIAHLKHDYTLLKLKNAHIRIIPAFSEEEIRDISSAIDTSNPLGMRNLAIILLAYGTGLRGADVVNMKLKDIDWRRQYAKVVQTKTRNPLIVELNGSILNAMADYILSARPKCDVPEVFVTVKAPYRKLTSQFAGMIDKYCERANIEKIPFRAFHSLRRSFETVLVTRGVPIEIASRMLGHKSINEDKPYITHSKEKIAFVAMDFSDVPINAGIYAKTRCIPKTSEGVPTNDF